MKIFNSLTIIVFLTIVSFFQNHAAAQNSPIDPMFAEQYFREANALCERDGGKLWGVSLCAPLLFVDRQTRAVAANRADRENILTKNGNVFIGRLPAKINVANTAVDWAGVKWTMVIYPLPEEKQRRAALLAHEMWHRVQDDLGFPSSGAENAHLDVRDGRIWLQLEWRALERALTVSGNGKRRQAIADALLFRARRRAIFPHAAREERQMEMHEGLAEYTGVKFSGTPNPKRYVARINLREAAAQPTFVRSFAYATGAAYGVLLDEANPVWRKNLKKENDLGDLLQRNLTLKLPRALRQAATRRAAIYDGDRLQAFETERANERRKMLAAYRVRLIENPVLELPLQKMNMQFNPGNLLPLAAAGTIYPDIRIVDVWGILTVAKNGALINPNFSKIYVSAPNNPGASPIQGDGWTLELNAGWTMTNGVRKGDYIVIKSK